MLAILRHRIRRYRELVLAGVFVVMASWELGEMWLETATSGPSLSAGLVHAIQVAVILSATYLVLRAWQEKTAREEALARLVEQVSLAQEEERRRIAYDMHDGIAQLIVSAKQHLDTCGDLWTLDRDRAHRELVTSADRLGRAIVETRRMLMALRPPALDAVGLAGAVRDVAREAAHEGGWSMRFIDHLAGERLPAAVETAAFRIAQEALVNCLRHAGTSRVDVTLARRDGWLELDVRDFGVGFATGADGRGLGLRSMHERARLLGGAVAIDAAPGRGTRVIARLPLHHGA